MPANPEPKISTLREISLGRGLRAPSARRVAVADPAELARALGEHAGPGAWWSPHVWTGDRRASAAWEGAAAIAVDLDHYDADGRHSPPPADFAERLGEDAHGLPGSFFHATPRGLRVIFWLAEPSTDRARYRGAAEGAAAELEAQLRELDLLGDRASGRPGLCVDGGALCDLARILWGPNAHADGEPEPRHAEVLRLVPKPYDAEALAALAPEREPAAPPPAGGDAMDRVLRGPVDRLRAALLARPGSRETPRGISLRCAWHDDSTPSAIAFASDWAVACSACGYRAPLRTWLGTPEGRALAGEELAAEILALGRAEAPSRPIGIAPAAVVEQWRAQGPLRHLPTKLATLDRVTRNGFTVPRRVVVVGAPGSGKTALVCALADRWVAAGAIVGILAVDEDPEDLTCRLAQRRGHSVESCEARRSWDLDVIAKDLDGLTGLVFYDGLTTIEGAAEALSKRGDAAAPHVLIVDSLQTARCAAALAAEASPRSPDETALVRMNAQALRAVADKLRMLVVATSEAPRSQYMNADLARTANRLASAKGSSTVEYAAQSLLYLESVAGESDLVRCEIVKNRRGAAGPGEFYLRLDRERQDLAEVDAPTATDPEASRVGRAGELVAAAVRIVAERPGVGARDLVDRLRRTEGVGRQRAADAVAQAEDEGSIEDRPVRHGSRTDHRFYPPDEETAPTAPHSAEGSASHCTHTRPLYGGAGGSVTCARAPDDDGGSASVLAPPPVPEGAP